MTVTVTPHLILLITGYRGSGKSIVARWFARSYGAEHISIMSPLRQITRAIFDLSPAQVDGDLKDTPINDRSLAYASPRDLMIKVSDAIKEQLGDTVWVNRVIDHIDDQTTYGRATPRLFVIEGVRPAYEAEALAAFAADRGIRHAILRLRRAGDLPVDDLDRSVDEYAADLDVTCGECRDPQAEIPLQVLPELVGFLNRNVDLIPLFAGGDAATEPAS